MHEMRYIVTSMYHVVSGRQRSLLRGWSQNQVARGPLRHLRPCLEAMESRRLLSVSITEFRALSNGQNGAPTQITVGSDNNLWFTEPAGNAIGIFHPTTYSVSQISLATTLVGANPPGITATGSGSNG